MRKTAYICAVGLALLSNAVLFAARSGLGVLFGSSDDVSAMVVQVLPIFLFGLIFYAFSRITTSGFYATENNLYSYLCVYAEPALLLILLFLLPLVLGQTGVWWSVVLSQILTACLALALKTAENKKNRRLSLNNKK